MSNNNPLHAYVTSIGEILSLFCSVSVLNFFRPPHFLVLYVAVRLPFILKYAGSFAAVFS